MTDRIICKNCGNNDFTKLEFIENNRYIRCKICNSVTPLFSDYKINEVTGTVRMEGLQSYDEKLKNGYNLLRLHEFERASVIFSELEKDYSNDYRTWFGAVRASTRNFEKPAVYGFDVAENAARNDPQGRQILSEAKEYQTKLSELNNSIYRAKQSKDLNEKKLAELSMSKEPEDNMLDYLQEKKEDREKDLKILSTAKRLPIQFLLTVAGIALYIFLLVRDGQMEQSNLGFSFIILFAFLFMAVSALIFLLNLLKCIISIPAISRKKKEIAALSREIDQKESTLKTQRNQHEQKVKTGSRECTQGIEKADQNIQKYQEELEHHKAQLPALLDKWDRMMQV